MSYFVECIFFCQFTNVSFSGFIILELFVSVAHNLYFVVSVQRRFPLPLGD